MWRRTAVVLVLFAAAAVAASIDTSDPTVVKTNLGYVKGEQIDAAMQFLGVPFAAPPVGDLRWKRPQPGTPWEGVRDATRLSPACPQNANGLVGFTSVSEDCLYLNVFTPSNYTEYDGKLPVRIFIYGGSWSWGSNALPIYTLIETLNIGYARPHILVVPNYRLEVFGFGANPALADEDPLGSTGNYGLQDQRAAMKWVQENIAAFGGDPNMVTLSGESAGAGSTSTHLVTPESWPYFQNALMESGPPAVWTTSTLAHAEAHFDRMVDALGCSGGTDAEVVACMRKVNMTMLIDNQENPHATLVSWTPTVDFVEMSYSPPQLVQNGTWAKVPVLMTTNACEGTLLMPDLVHDATEAQYEAWLSSTYGFENVSNIVEMINSVYSIDDYSSYWDMAQHTFGDAAMSCPARRNARWMTSSGAPVYLGFYTHVLDLIDIFDPSICVFHGSELVPVFANVELLGPNEQQLSKWFTRYWSNYAQFADPNGDPNGPLDPRVPLAWPKYSLEEDLVLDIDTTCSTIQHLKNAQCDMWDKVFAMTVPAIH